MKAFRLSLVSVMLVIASVFLLVGFAGAQEVRTADAVTVAKGAVVDKTVFYVGRDIVIDGTVNGDVFCAGQNISINGTVNGDVFCAGQNLRLGGTVSGSARLAGQNVTLAGTVSGNISIAGSTVVQDESSIAGQDAQIGGDVVTLRGDITRDLAVSARTIFVGGNVGRDFTSNNDTLVIADTALIGQNLSYRSNNDAKIADGSVVGTVTKTTPPQAKPVDAAKAFLLGYGYWFVALLIIAFAVLLLFPKQLAISAKSANSRPWRTALVGFLALTLPPIAITIIGLTLVGIPMAMILILIYILALCMSGPFFAFFVGTKFLPEQRPWIRMLLGSTIILISYALPVIGIIMGIVVAVFGTGMFAEVIMERLPKEINVSKSTIE